MLSNLLSVTCDWNVPDTIIQIVASILGAFLGFLFAIKVSELDNKKSNNEHIKNLYTELETFYEDKNIQELKKNVTNAENIKIINLPFLERTVNLNLCYNILGNTIFKKLKELNLAVEQINHIFSKKNDCYYENALVIAKVNAKLESEIDKEIKELLTHDSLENKYIAYVKTIYDKIMKLLFVDPKDKKIKNNSILDEFKSDKKINKIVG